MIKKIKQTDILQPTKYTEEGNQNYMLKKENYILFHKCLKVKKK